MDIKKQVEYFKTLPYETKKTKVLEMLRQLQWVYETFEMFYTTITTLSSVSEEVLIYIYTWILEIAEKIEQGKNSDAEDKIRKMAEVLMAITKKEEQEREREWSPEHLLEQI